MVYLGAVLDPKLRPRFGSWATRRASKAVAKGSPSTASRSFRRRLLCPGSTSHHQGRSTPRPGGRHPADDPRTLTLYADGSPSVVLKPLDLEHNDRVNLRTSFANARGGDR